MSALNTGHDNEDSNGYSAYKEYISSQLLKCFEHIEMLSILGHGHHTAVVFGQVGPEVDAHRPCLVPSDKLPALDVYLIEYVGTVKSSSTMIKQFKPHRIKPSFLRGNSHSVLEARRDLREKKIKDIPFVILVENYGMGSHFGAGGKKVRFLLMSRNGPSVQYLQELLVEISSEEGEYGPQVSQNDITLAHEAIIREASREYLFSEEFSEEDGDDIDLTGGEPGHH